jgi:hypothetical protein
MMDVLKERTASFAAVFFFITFFGKTFRSCSMDVPCWPHCVAGTVRIVYFDNARTLDLNFAMLFTHKIISASPHMRKRTALISTVLAIAVGAVCFLWARGDRVYFEGYYVNNRPGKEQVVALLQKLQGRLHAFLQAAPTQDPRFQRIREKWSGTLAEIDGESQREGSLAYSLNKDSIHVCVRAADGSLADENTATFVLIHELAHIATHSYGHTDEFWNNMKYLLEVAEKLGFYRYVHHGKTPTTLCGHQLGTSPLTCVREKTCSSTLT